MFSSYEELMQTVEERRKDTLTLEVDLGAEYSPEYEEAKKNLAQAEGLAKLGETKFLSDNVDTMKAKADALKPHGKPVWIKFKRLDLMEWAVLVKSASSMTVFEQYEKVLKKTFVGVYGTEDAEVPLSDDHRLLSSKGTMGILPGGALQGVIQAFMSWQNSGGEVSIRPTKSGRD